jgi:hypothetical protein
MRRMLLVVFALGITGWLWLDAGAQGGGPVVSGAHRFERIADGIYYATRTITTTTCSGTRCSGPTSRSSATITRASG